MAPRSFPALPSIREEGWADPGPPVSAPVEIVAAPKPALAPECPPARECCEEFRLALDAGLLGAQCCVPFEPRRATPPTAYLFSDGGHHGWAAIKFCPFCGAPVTFKETPNGPA